MSQSVLIISAKPSPRSADPFAWRERRGAPEVARRPRRTPFRAALVLMLVASGCGVALHEYPFLAKLPAFPASLHLPWRGADVRVENVTSRLVDQGRTLLVEGVIVNATGRDITAPALRLAVRDTDQAEIFVWAAHAADSHLAPEARTRFSSRLASPPSGGADVTVALLRAGN